MVRMIFARKSFSPPTQSWIFSRERIVKKSVHREVAARRIGLGVGEDDFLRPPAIAVIRLGAERGDLKLLAAFDDDDDAEFFADGNGLA